ncbi:MAG: hypothetical protein OEW12_09120 [Deltaproteobacteria bacterium]|nr:hypothetical protein [Deltaproteobacteria bacterium]
MAKLYRLFVGELGRCPACMRLSLYGAVGSAGLFVLAVDDGAGSWIMWGLSMGLMGFGGLFAAHMLAYGVRNLKKTNKAP